MSSDLIKQRLIITYGKFDALKYTSNLDTAKIWERVLRRAGLPLLYSQGFNTRPRIQLAAALPLGITSECELIDISLKERIALDGLAERLLAVSPHGLRIYQIEEASPHMPSLESMVRSAEYRIHFLDDIDPAQVQQAIDTMLNTGSIIKVVQGKRRKSVYDLRPLIYDLHLDDRGDLIAHVAVGKGGNIRPDEILHEMQIDASAYTVHRLHLHLDKVR